MIEFTRSGKSNRERDMARGAHLFRVTEDILVAMEDLGITKSELAKRLGNSKSRITQLLSGDSNMTIGTLADISFELGLPLDKTFKEYSALRERMEGQLASEQEFVDDEFASSSIQDIGGNDSDTQVNQQLDPSGIELALQRDREIEAGQTTAISKKEFLRRIRRD